MLAEKYMLLLETIRSLAEQGAGLRRWKSKGHQHVAARAGPTARRGPEVKAA